MSEDEYATYLERLTREYAEEHRNAGTWPAEEALNRSRAELDKLLPAGPATKGMEVLHAVDAEDAVVGQVWLGVERRKGSDSAYLYDIELVPEARGQGRGRQLLGLVEARAGELGCTSLELNVFGRNHVARRLYDAAGYEVVTQMMRKRLS